MQERPYHPRDARITWRRLAAAAAAHQLHQAMKLCKKLAEGDLRQHSEGSESCQTNNESLLMTGSYSSRVEISASSYDLVPCPERFGGLCKPEPGVGGGTAEVFVFSCSIR